MEADPTIIRLRPSDVDGFRPADDVLRQAAESTGPVVILIGPDVPFFSATAALVLRLIDIVVGHGDEVTVEASPLKVDMLRVLGFAGVARLRPNPDDDSWLFSR